MTDLSEERLAELRRKYEAGLSAPTEFGRIELEIAELVLDLLTKERQLLADLAVAEAARDAALASLRKADVRQAIQRALIEWALW